MESVLRITPIGKSKTGVYGSVYDTLEDAVKESYFYLCYVAGQEPDIDEAELEFTVCLDDNDDTETTVFKAHIKYVYNPKQKLVKEIKFLSFKSYHIDDNLIESKISRTLFKQGKMSHIEIYPNLVSFMERSYEDWFGLHEYLDYEKKISISYTAHGKTLFEANVKLIWDEDYTKSIQFIKVKNIRKEEDKKANEEWKAFLKKMEGKEINL